MGSICLSSYLPECSSITEEITKTDDIRLVHHPTGAHGDASDTVSVEFQ